MNHTDETFDALAPDLTSKEKTSGVDPDELKLLFRGHPAGVAVITGDAGFGPVGMTATSLISVSVTPPLVVFSASDLSSSTPTLLECDTLVVHMISTLEHDLAELCATSGIDRFADRTLWDRLPTGEPFFRGASKRFRGKVVNKLTAGASTLFVVQVLSTWREEPSGARPLVYHARAWHELSDASRRD